MQEDSVARQVSLWILWSERDRSQEGGLPPRGTNIAQMSTERIRRDLALSVSNTREC